MEGLFGAPVTGHAATFGKPGTQVFGGNLGRHWESIQTQQKLNRKGPRQECLPPPCYNNVWVLDFSGTVVAQTY